MTSRTDLTFEVKMATEQSDFNKLKDDYNIKFNRH